MIVEEVKIQTGDSARTVKDLRKELKDLKDQLLNTAQGTKEYSEAVLCELEKNPDVVSIDEKQDYKEFVSLVKRMREAQRNYYKDRPKVGYKVAYNNMINKEQLVDDYLKKMEI